MEKIEVDRSELLDDISPRLDETGKALGRPWRKDHQLATTAAIAVSRLL